MSPDVYRPAFGRRVNAGAGHGNETAVGYLLSVGEVDVMKESMAALLTPEASLS
jgi:hypothetical protein